MKNVDAGLVFLYLPAAAVWATGLIWYGRKWWIARRRRSDRSGGSWWWRHFGMGP